MFAGGNTTLRLVIPRTALSPAPHLRISPRISFAPCVALARKTSLRSNENHT